MIRLYQRLDRLERRMGLAGPCCECGGGGRVNVVPPGGNESDVEGCERCGRTLIVCFREAKPIEGASSCVH